MKEILIYFKSIGNSINFIKELVQVVFKYALKKYLSVYLLYVCM